MSSSRTGTNGIPARLSHAANRRRRPSAAALRHLVICRMQIWRPLGTDRVPVRQAPHQVVDPLIQMVLTGRPPAAPLPVHLWWEDVVEMEVSSSRLSKRQLPTPNALSATSGTADASRSYLHLATLSGREKEILLLVAEGLPNKAIADRLIIAESTVKWYLKQIYLKLDVHNRAQAIVRLHQST